MKSAVENHGDLLSLDYAALYGRMLTSSVAQTLEGFSSMNILDVSNRAKLLGFYLERQKDADYEQLSLWSHHVLWFAKNAPDCRFAGDVYLTLPNECPEDLLTLITESWMKASKARSDIGSRVLVNAALQILPRKQTMSQTLLAKYEDITGDRLWQDCILRSLAPESLFDLPDYKVKKDRIVMDGPFMHLLDGGALLPSRGVATRERYLSIEPDFWQFRVELIGFYMRHSARHNVLGYDPDCLRNLQYHRIWFLINAPESEMAHYLETFISEARWRYENSLKGEFDTITELSIPTDVSQKTDGLLPEPSDRNEIKSEYAQLADDMCLEQSVYRCRFDTVDLIPALERLTIYDELDFYSRTMLIGLYECLELDRSLDTEEMESYMRHLHFFCDMLSESVLLQSFGLGPVEFEVSKLGELAKLLESKLRPLADNFTILENIAWFDRVAQGYSTSRWTDEQTTSCLNSLGFRAGHRDPVFEQIVSKALPFAFTFGLTNTLDCIQVTERLIAAHPADILARLQLLGAYSSRSLNRNPPPSDRLCWNQVKNALWFIEQTPQTVTQIAMHVYPFVELIAEAANQQTTAFMTENSIVENLSAYRSQPS